MMAYPSQPRMMLGQLCTAQSQPVVIQPGIKPGSVVTPLALRYSALDHCAIREPHACRASSNWCSEIECVTLIVVSVTGEAEFDRFHLKYGLMYRVGY